MSSLNRLIEIQRRAVTRDSFGSEVVTWVKVDTVWAELLQQKPSERFLKTSKRTVNMSTKRYRILAREDVNELMRVVDEWGQPWDITGIIKNDRQFLTLQLQHSP